MASTEQEPDLQHSRPAGRRATSGGTTSKRPSQRRPLARLLLLALVGVSIFGRSMTTTRIW